MARITKNVNKTLVTGSEIFIYTINASYSGLTIPAQEGQITDVFPGKILYILPPTGGMIKSITQTPDVNGTKVTFNLGTVNSGTSLSFTIACSFGPGRRDNDSFTNEIQLLADGVIVAQATAPTVNLQLNENFILRKSAQPSNIVNPGEELTITLSLTNNNHPGATITNVVVTDTLPPELTPVTSFIPVGNDASTNGYEDPSANGLTGSWSGSTMTFNLPQFSGERYDIIFKVTVEGSVTPNQSFTNIGTWTTNDQARNDAPLTFSVFDPSATGFGLRKVGTRTTVVGGPINYNIINFNAGSIPINNYVLEDNIPSQVDITSYRLTFTQGLINYGVYISLASDPTIYIPIVENVSVTPQPLTDLTPYIPIGDRIAKIMLTAQTLNLVEWAHTLSIFGVTNSTAVFGETFVNTAIATSGDIIATSSWVTNVNGASDLSIIKTYNPNLMAYYPLEEFNIHLRGEARNTITIYPILIDLMPIGLRYLADSEYFLYSDAETGTIYDSRQPGFPVPLPTKEVIPNFAGTEQTLLRWSFFNFIVPLGSAIQVVFKAFVEINPPSTFLNKAYEGMPGNTVVFVTNAVNDPLDLDNDGLTTTDTLSYTEIEKPILTTSEYSLKKLVKGDLDLDYSSNSITYPSGTINYRLEITNNQVVSLKDIEIVDILPYVGDTGVILTEQQRGSQFDVYAISTVTAEIINLIGDPVDPNPNIIIEYSTSNDPQRFDQLGNPIGTGSWSLLPPSNITTLRSIKVTTASSVTLKSYERLIISFQAKVPVGVIPGRIAYNSYAVRANKIIGGTTEPLLPTEPPKVSTTIATATLGSIGDFVWEDLNRNGLYEVGEPGINGITVELYSEFGQLLRTTVTANDANNNPGYYEFAGLTDGVYQVRFLPFGEYLLTQQQSGESNGSKPDPVTGFTPYITMSNSQQILDIDAGVIERSCNPPVIDAENSCLHVGDTFDPMSGVSATDCNGNDITDDIVVTFNDVDTSKAGVYSVSYSVTDSRGQISTKTVMVTVCEVTPRAQAITDIIQSIALEQTALSHILNAQGEKLKKATVLDLSNRDLILINNSVREMISSVMRLENILQTKLESFNCDDNGNGNICDECCKRQL